jgi:membrane protein
MAIPGLRGMNLVTLIRRALKDFNDHDMLTHASALAFQALFSMFPFVLFLTALLGFLQLTQFVEWVHVHATAMLPREAAGTVNEVVAGLQKQDVGLLSFGAVVALWSASAAVRVIMHATNRAFNVTEERPALQRYLLSILYTLGLAAMLIAAAVLMNLGPGALEWIARQVGLDQAFVAVWPWLRWPAAFLLLVLSSSVIYYAAPNVKQDFRLITPGAMVSITVWIVASLGFNYYVSNFANYNAMYGSIGAVIALLFYFFISSAVLLFGAEVNAVVQRHAPEVGDARPKDAPT